MNNGAEWGGSPAAAAAVVVLYPQDVAYTNSLQRTSNDIIFTF